jgi:hypothetical protein
VGNLTLNPTLPHPPSMSNSSGSGLSLASYDWSSVPVILSNGQSSSFSIEVNPVLCNSALSGSGRLSLESTAVSGTPSLYNFSWYTKPSATGSGVFLTSSLFNYITRMDNRCAHSMLGGAGGPGGAQNGGELVEHICRNIFVVSYRNLCYHRRPRWKHQRRRHTIFSASNGKLS